MALDIEALILRRLAGTGVVKVSEISKETGFSRAYVNRFFRTLQNAGKIVLIGKANRAHYVLPQKKAVDAAHRSILSTRKVLVNKNLSEDVVLNRIQKETGIFLGITKNVSDIFSYAFTEILNNAIEHSQSRKIEVNFIRGKSEVNFFVVDYGVGIFNNLIKKRKLKNEFEAIQDLIKGKQTTAPREHTGEGIFFTSKVADVLTIQSSNKKLIFNNMLDDIFVRDTKNIAGTKVSFTVSIRSRRKLNTIFREYAGRAFEFSKTKVVVKLFQLNTGYISRSQARRVISGLDKFKTVILDFKGVDTVGQAFADEVFRVWQSRHSDISITTRNMTPNVAFMVRRALSE